MAAAKCNHRGEYPPRPGSYGGLLCRPIRFGFATIDLKLGGGHGQDSCAAQPLIAVSARLTFEDVVFNKTLLNEQVAERLCIGPGRQVEQNAT
jgi:hypothetical protein